VQKKKKGRAGVPKTKHVEGINIPFLRSGSLPLAMVKHIFFFQRKKLYKIILSCEKKKDKYTGENNNQKSLTVLTKQTESAGTCLIALSLSNSEGLRPK